MAIVVFPQGANHAFWHPPNPLPPEPNGYQFDRAQLEGDDNTGNGNDGALRRWDGRLSLGITEFLDKNLGGVYFGSSLNTGWRNRTRKNKAPGYYMDSPGNPAFPPDHLMDSQKKNLDKRLREILTPQYYSAEVCEYGEEYENVLGDSARIEFCGRVTINGKKFALGGWFGKLTAVGVFDDDNSYDDVKGFLDRAREYFLLPPISADDVKVATSDDDFFYSYLDRDSGFMLRGYRVSLDSPDEGQPSIRAKVIEYIKYYDPEFVP